MQKKKKKKKKTLRNNYTKNKYEMNNEHDSLTSKHKITLDELTCH